MSQITAIIHTKNEERNIAQAIRSVRWADEVLIVDMESSDRTVEIAQSLGARILAVPNANYADPARAAGVRAASFPWIVYIDADELIPAELAKRLRELAEQPIADAYLLPRLNYMFGHAIGHGGWGADQDEQFRFFRKDALDVHPDIHRKPSLLPGKKKHTLTSREVPPIVHFNYLDTNHFVTKLLRYTDIEARSLPPKPPTLMGMLLTMSKEFTLRFIALRAFQDGWRGLYLTILMVAYRVIAYAKAGELLEERTLGSVQSRYDKITAETISGHADERR